MRTTLGVNMLRRDPAALAAWAAQTPQGFDVMRHGVAHHIDRDEPLPDAAQQWLARFMLNPSPPRQGRGGRDEDTVWKLRIFMAVTHLVAHGMNPTRNDATADNSSACDAVAEALKQLDRAPRSYSRVKRIYSDFKSGMPPNIDAT